MKPPHGLFYAILIIVGILAVTLYAKRQGSTIVAGAAIKAQAREPVADDASSNTKNDDGSRAESAKISEDPSK